MNRQRLLSIGLSLTLNILLSWSLLPLVLPQTAGYRSSKLLEVLLWQVIGAVGWPLALLGMMLSIPFGARISGGASLVLVVLYPAIEVLLVRVGIARTWRRVEFVLLHLLVTLSFGVVWHAVLSGYDFMLG